MDCSARTECRGCRMKGNIKDMHKLDGIIRNLFAKCNSIQVGWLAFAFVKFLHFLSLISNLSLQILDHDPQHICFHCYKQTTAWASFRIMVQQKDKHFRENYVPKAELPENNDSGFIKEEEEEYHQEIGSPIKLEHDIPLVGEEWQREDLWKLEYDQWVDLTPLTETKAEKQDQENAKNIPDHQLVGDIKMEISEIFSSTTKESINEYSDDKTIINTEREPKEETADDANSLFEWDTLSASESEAPTIQEIKRERRLSLSDQNELSVDQFICPVCEEDFVDRQLLRIHIKSHLLKGVRFE